MYVVTAAQLFGSRVCVHFANGTDRIHPATIGSTIHGGVRGFVHQIGLLVQRWLGSWSLACTRHDVGRVTLGASSPDFPASGVAEFEQTPLRRAASLEQTGLGESVPQSKMTLGLYRSMARPNGSVGWA